MPRWGKGETVIFAPSPRHRLILVSLVVGVLILLAVNYSLNPYWHYSGRIREGNRLVEKIEAYRRNDGRLPHQLEDVEVETRPDGPLYYQKTGKATYIIWFGTTLGNSMKHDSRRKVWTETG